jgi:PilZ domain
MVEDSAEDLRQPAADRRRQQRLLTRGTALVRIQRRELRADTVDISAHGVCLTLPRALEVGSTCELDLELEIQGATTRHTSVVARVCFCLHGKNGYRIGLNCALEDFVGDGAA